MSIPRLKLVTDLSVMGWRPCSNKAHWRAVCKEGLLVGRYTDETIARENDYCPNPEDLLTPEVWAANGWNRGDFDAEWPEIPYDFLLEIYLKITMEGL